MLRTNSVFLWDIIRACSSGLLAGLVGWCLHKPSEAAVVGFGLAAQIEVVISGPLVNNQSPTFSQLVAFAWVATDFVSGVVFFSFFATVSVSVFLLLEWADRSATPRLQK